MNKQLKQAADRLREARDLMNHGGRHWIKGAEVRWVDPELHEPGDDSWSASAYTDSSSLEPAYCSIGAIKKIDAGELAVITLAEVIDAEAMRHTREVTEYDYSHYCEGSELESRVHESMVYAAQDIVVGFNDRDVTTWDDVRSAFTRAAKRLADRARKSS